MGALKSALTAIFNANNYTSATSGIASKKIPVNESNGLPSGQIGMSDLASVLGGGAIAVQIGTNDDLNDYSYSTNKLGLFFIDGDDNVSNKPNSSLHNFILLNIKQGSSNRMVQFFFCFNSFTLHVRIKTSVWSSWEQVMLT